MNKSELKNVAKKEAKKLGVDEIFVTSDGQCFTKKSFRDLHARNNKLGTFDYNANQDAEDAEDASNAEETKTKKATKETTKTVEEKKVKESTKSKASTPAPSEEDKKKLAAVEAELDKANSEQTSPKATK